MQTSSEEDVQHEWRFAMSVSKRKGKKGTSWVVCYRDSSNTRRYLTFKTRAEANLADAKKKLVPGGNPNIRFEEIAEDWMAINRAKVRAQSLEFYEIQLRLHLLPTLAKRRVAKITRSDVERLLAEKLTAGYAPKTVGNLCTTLYGILERAVRDGLIASNPVQGCARELGLKRRAPVNRAVKALTPVQIEQLLEITQQKYPHLYPFFLTMARTGMRIGEAIGLKWSDVDLVGHHDGEEMVYQITVQRSLRRDGGCEPTKTERIRRIDMGQMLREELRRQHRLYLEADLRSGRTAEEWVFKRPPGSRGDGAHLRPHTVDVQFKKILIRAGLPTDLVPHSLRHSFASIHIQNGKPLGWIIAQLGHASATMTHDLYGHWLSKTNMKAADSLDTAARRPEELEKESGEQKSETFLL